MPRCKAQKKFRHEAYFLYVEVSGFFLERSRWVFPATLQGTTLKSISRKDLTKISPFPYTLPG